MAEDFSGKKKFASSPGLLRFAVNGSGALNPKP